MLPLVLLVLSQTYLPPVVPEIAMPEVSIESDSIKEALTSAWNDLEGEDYERAVSKFGAVYNSSVETNARVVAAYGAGVAHYHLGDYLAASTWFMTEDEYEKSLRITPKIEDTIENIAYNVAADSLIARSLYWQAMCLELTSAYGDALVLYQHIADTYPGQSESVNAFKKIIDCNIAGGRAKAIESMIGERWGTWFGVRYDLESAKELYCYALARLYEYHLDIGDEVKAEKYAKKLQAIVPTEWIDVYRQGHDSYKPTIEDLKRKIELIGKNDAYNKATQLALFDLSILLIEAERFDEATETLMKLKAWPDTAAVSKRMPEISYQLARIYFNREDYIECVKELVWWRSHFEEGKDARIDIAPFIHYFLGLSYLNLGDIELLSVMESDYYAKAEVSFRIIKDRYDYSGLYYDNSEKINQYIEECEKKIAGVE